METRAVAVTEIAGRAALGGVSLVCPADKKPLTATNDGLRCADGHTYPMTSGVAVLLPPGAADSHPYFEESRQAAGNAVDDTSKGESGGVDAFVQQEIVKTNGLLYRNALGALTRYPIPNISLPQPQAESRLLDIGCNWGRWSLAASRRGYHAIGIDPGINAVRAAYRVSRELRLPAEFLVGDGRSLPFPDDSFDVVYSYSVLQHFSKDDARTCIREASRVTKRGGVVMVQLANLLGVRQFYNQIGDLVRRERNMFRVRRWTPREMRETFTDLVGPTELTADGFFSLNAQPTDLDLMGPVARLIVHTSQGLKRVSQLIRPLTMFADSVFISAHKTC